MKNNYEERKQRKLDNYKRLAEKAESKSNDLFNNGRKIMKHIPFGQPVLVDHHSEKRHRRDLQRIDSYRERAMSEADKAKYYRNKIKQIENNTSISSDDPEAIIKLQAKLKERIDLQDFMKEANKKAKKEDKPRIYEPFQLQNNNANINRIKKRIAELEAKANGVTKVLYKDKNVEILDNVEDNRLQLYFTYVPSFEIRTELKKNGFKWSRYNVCWQRFRSSHDLYLTKKIINTFIIPFFFF